MSQKLVTSSATNKNFRNTIIIGKLITPTIGQRKMVLFSHLTYFVQVSYLGKMSNPDEDEVSFSSETPNV